MPLQRCPSQSDDQLPRLIDCRTLGRLEMSGHIAMNIAMARKVHHQL